MVAEAISTDRYRLFRGVRAIATHQPNRALTNGATTYAMRKTMTGVSRGQSFSLEFTMHWATEIRSETSVAHVLEEGHRIPILAVVHDQPVLDRHERGIAHFIGVAIGDHVA
jgi:hypothetical protein